MLVEDKISPESRQNWLTSTLLGSVEGNTGYVDLDGAVPGEE